MLIGVLVVVPTGSHEVGAIGSLGVPATVNTGSIGVPAAAAVHTGSIGVSVAVNTGSIGVPVAVHTGSIGVSVAAHVIVPELQVVVYKWCCLGLGRHRKRHRRLQSGMR